MAAGQSGADEAEDFRPHVGGNLRGVLVLHVAAVDAEGGQSLLGVPGQHGGQVDRPRPLSAVETPDGLGQQRIHVHGFRAVAPAGRDGERHAHARSGELLRRPGGLGDAADAGVGDDAFHRRAARVAERSEISRATVLARPMVWFSSDSRTPLRRPSMAGRMPTFGSVPTRRF